MKSWLHCLQLIKRYHSSMIPVAVLSALFHALEIPVLLYALHLASRSILLENLPQELSRLIFCISIETILHLLALLCRQSIQHYSIRLSLFARYRLARQICRLDYATLSTIRLHTAILEAQRSLQLGGGLGAIFSSLEDIVTRLLTILSTLPFTFAFWTTEPLAPWVAPLTLCSLGLFFFLELAAERRLNTAQKRQFELVLQMDMRFDYLDFKIYFNPIAFKAIVLHQMQNFLLPHTIHNAAFSNRASELLTSGHLQVSLLRCSEILCLLFLCAGSQVSLSSLPLSAGAFLFSFSFLRLPTAWRAFRVRCDTLRPYIDFCDNTETYSVLSTGSIPVEKRLDGVYEFEFHDVSFTYPGSSLPALSHVNCKISLKGHTTIVGPNGAGKSTFVKLLCRFFDPTEGYITLNGIDIRKYNEQEYAHLFGLLVQNFSFFPFSLFENVALSPTPNESRVYYCLRRAGISRQKASHWQALSEQNTETMPWSESDQQKIALARVLYQDAPVVILDEPTSTLDIQDESDFYNQFHSLMQDKTSLLISHRLGSCPICDSIVVFDQGKLVQQGRHETLLAESEGVYARLWAAQQGPSQE